MADLRAQYERETDHKLSLWDKSSDYVRWLERRAACAEELAELLDDAEHDIRQRAMPDKDWLAKTRIALADYEAACKEKS